MSVRPDNQKVRRLRTEQGWSQEELAAEAGCSKKTIENMERGNPVSLRSLREVATALEVDVKDLIADAPAAEDVVEPTHAVSGSVPGLPPLFIGREQAMRELRARFRPQGRSGLAIQVMTAVRGWPGVGKTTVAAMLAHDPKIHEQFPDGVLWASLGEKPNILGALRSWGRALGASDILLARNVEEARSALSGLLGGQRRFLVLDDVWKPEHVSPFRIGGPGCAMLITTRLPSVSDAVSPTPGDSYNLEVLDEESGLQLLQTVAPDVVEAHSEDCRALVKELEGLPLALVVAGKQLHVDAARGWDVTTLLGELREDASRLLERGAPADMTDLVSDTTPTVAALLRKTTDRLDADTQERFAFLGAFAPKPATFALEDMAAVWRVPEQEARNTVDILIDHGLLEPTGDGRFWMHALLKKLARSLCSEE